MVEGQCNNSNISLCTKIIASSLLLVKIHPFSALWVQWRGLWSRYLPAPLPPLPFPVLAVTFVPRKHSLGLWMHHALWCGHQLKSCSQTLTWGSSFLGATFLRAFLFHSEFLRQLSTSPLRYCSLSTYISAVRARISWFSFLDVVHSLALTISMCWFSA